MSDKMMLFDESFIEEQVTNDPKAFVMLRIKLLEGNGPGFPSLFMSIIRQAYQEWLELISRASGDVPVGIGDERTVTIRRVLSLCSTMTSMDRSLAEELGYEGLHVILSKIISLDPHNFSTEDDQDILMEVQDPACKIASLAPSFPMWVAPYTRQELWDRLPLMFSISAISKNKEDEKDDMGFTILINEVKERQSSQADVGFLMWPSAVVLSRYLTTNPELVVGKDIIELGSGCGLTGLVAAQLIASQGHGKGDARVFLTDCNKTVIRNCQHNIQLNGLSHVAKAEELDFYKQDLAVHGWLDSNGTRRPQVDLILAADVICQHEDAFSAARTIFCALKKGGKAIAVSADSQHRYGVERLREACNQVGLLVSSTMVRNLYDGKLISSDMEKTTGYVEGMSLIMHSIEKL